MDGTPRLHRMGAMVLVASLIGAPRSFPASAPELEAQRHVASVSGTVYDSISGAPLLGANVQFVATAEGRAYTAISNSTGRYAFDSLPPGSYVAGFSHVVLDTLGIESSPRVLQIHQGGGSLEFNLATPSPKTFIDQLCPPRAGTDSTGMLIGHVRRTDSEEPIVGASITVEWGELLIERANISHRNRAGVAETQGPGWFALCEVPAGIPLTVRAAFGPDSSGTVDVEVPRDGLRHLTILVGGAIPVRDPSAQSGEPPATSWTGTARLTGLVLDETGQPVAGARLHVVGTTVDAATTTSGRFVLDSLPGGTQTLEVKSLGYLPTQHIVHLASSRPASIDVRILEATLLATVAVRAKLVYARNLVRFQANQRTARQGFFMTPAEIERRPVSRFSNLLHGIAGVRVSYQSGTMSIVMDVPGSQGGTAFNCEPAIYIDGARSRLSATDLESMYYTDEVAALEVYVRESLRPIEFQDAGSRCGAIVVWTRPPPRKPGPPS